MGLVGLEPTIRWLKARCICRYATDPLKVLSFQGAGGGLSTTLLEYHRSPQESSGVCQSQDWN